MLSLLPLLFGCPGTGTFEAEPTWQIEYFGASQLRATDGDEVVLDWTYSTDEEVAYQRLCFLYLYFDGLGQECFDHTSGFDFTAASRITSFIYGGAVTVMLHAEATDGRTAEAALDVRDLQDAYMRATLRNSQPLLPYVGQAQNPDIVVDGQPTINPGVDVEFSQFVAILDDDQNGRIDGLEALYGPDNHEVFRAKTVDVTEGFDSTFGFTQGPVFPAQHPADPSLGFSNLIVFGGAIAVTGEEGVYKADDGDGTFRRALTLGFDPIFLQLTYAWRSNGIIDPVDINVGNLNQGLVTGVVGTGFPGATFGTPHDVGTSELGGVYWVAGDVKGAETGHFITPYATGTPTYINSQVSSAQWEMPIRLDEELGDGSFVELAP